MFNLNIIGKYKSKMTEKVISKVSFQVFFLTFYRYNGSEWRFNNTLNSKIVKVSNFRLMTTIFPINIHFNYVIMAHRSLVGVMIIGSNGNNVNKFCPKIQKKHCASSIWHGKNGFKCEWLYETAKEIHQHKHSPNINTHFTNCMLFF